MDVQGGLCVFDVPGIQIDQMVEEGKVQRSDTRFKADATWNNPTYMKDKDGKINPTSTVASVGFEVDGIRSQVDIMYDLPKAMEHAKIEEIKEPEKDKGKAPVDGEKNPDASKETPEKKEEENGKGNTPSDGEKNQNGGQG